MALRRADTGGWLCVVPTRVDGTASCRYGWMALRRANTGRWHCVVPIRVDGTASCRHGWMALRHADTGGWHCVVPTRVLSMTLHRADTVLSMALRRATLALPMALPRADTGATDCTASCRYGRYRWHRIVLTRALLMVLRRDDTCATDGSPKHELYYRHLITLASAPSSALANPVTGLWHRSFIPLLQC